MLLRRIKAEHKNKQARSYHRDSDQENTWPYQSTCGTGAWLGTAASRPEGAKQRQGRWAQSSDHTDASAHILHSCDVEHSLLEEPRNFSSDFENNSAGPLLSPFYRWGHYIPQRLTASLKGETPMSDWGKAHTCPPGSGAGTLEINHRTTGRVQSIV